MVKVKSLSLLLATLATVCSITQVFALDIKVAGRDGYLQKEHVFKGFGCSGGNKSPEIRISGIPKEAKSLALTVYDPDAPTGAGWWHWLVVNLPVSKTSLGLGDAGLAKVGGVQTINSFGTQAYGGPCPPQGAKPHRYVFTVFALKVAKLEVKPTTQPNHVGFMLNANSLAKASSTLLYGR